MRTPPLVRAYLPIAALLLVGCSEPSLPSPQEPAAKQGQRGTGPTREQAAASGKKLGDIAIAVIDYESEKQELPLRALKTADGAPGLSWRVAILPMLGEEPLYKEFHLDEPWDSPHNKPLV